MVAAWDTKYAHNRPRPGEADRALSVAVATSGTPSYPCEYAVAAGAAAAVIAHIYPREAERVTSAAAEAARSRVMAGAAYPSDAQAGLELARTEGLEAHARAIAIRLEKPSVRASGSGTRRKRAR